MTVWLEVGDKQVRIALPEAAGLADGVVEYTVGDRTVAANAKMLQPGVMSLIVDGRQYRCVLDGDGVVIDGRRYGFEVSDPRSLQGRRGAGGGADGPRAVKAPMPGRVVRVLVAVGDEVAEGQGVVVIEAMKMQNELKSPKAGRVAKVGVTVEGTVSAGDVLVVVE